MTQMFRKFNGVLEKARQIEAAIASTVEGAAARATGAPATRSPLEIVHAIVDIVARDVQPTGRGRHGFPFNAVRVALLAPTARAKAQLQAVVDGPDPLPQRIDARLRSAGCVVDGLVVSVSYASKARADWTQPDFDVECVRVDAHNDGPAASVSKLKLRVAAGVTASEVHAFGPTDVTIGRGATISDSRGRLVRVNQVAFAEGVDDISQTVSRLHAHIAHDARTGAYRLFDDGSAEGTSVVRNGRGHVVSRGGRGIVLQSGDEIALGRARLAVTIVR